MFSKLSLVHLMPSWSTFLPSTAIAKLKVYVIRLHRLPTLMEYFVVRMAGDACSQGGLMDNIMVLLLLYYCNKVLHDVT
jgi:hypothetical protein